MSGALARVNHQHSFQPLCKVTLGWEMRHRLREGEQLAKVTELVGPFPTADSMQPPAMVSMSLSCAPPTHPCAALLTLPCDPWAPISSAEMPPTPLDYLIHSHLYPHLVGLSHQPLISFLRALCAYLTLPPVPKLLEDKVHDSLLLGVVGAAL